MATNKTTAHSVVQLFIGFRAFVHSVFRSLVFAGERPVDRMIVNSVIWLSVCSSGSVFVCLDLFLRLSVRLRLWFYSVL